MTAAGIPLLGRHSVSRSVSRAASSSDSLTVGQDLPAFVLIMRAVVAYAADRRARRRS